MGTRVKKDPALVYTRVAVHADVDISLEMDTEAGQWAAIQFGHDGPDVIIDFADVDSLEQLAQVAADGARQLREWIDENRTAARNRAGRLVGAGAA